MVIDAANVTHNDDQITTSAGHVGSAIDDEYGDSTALVIKNNNIFAFKTAIQVSAGLIQANYIHDPGLRHQLGTNHLGHFALVAGLLPLLRAGGARVTLSAGTVLACWIALATSSEAMILRRRVAS